MHARGRMSETLKEEIAKELGVYDIVKKAGWRAMGYRDEKHEATDRLRKTENGKGI